MAVDVSVSKILPEIAKMLERLGETKGMRVLSCIEDWNKVRDRYGEEISNEAIQFVVELARKLK